MVNVTEFNELKELRKEEFAAYKIVGRNEKKLNEIEAKLGARNLDLLQATIDLHRLEDEFHSKFSDNPVNTTESWENYLRVKKGLNQRIEKLREEIKKESNLKKECVKNANKAKKSSKPQEAGAWILESHDHQDAMAKLSSEIGDYYKEIDIIRKEAEQNPEYKEGKVNIGLAKTRCENLKEEISDLQKEYNAQEKIYKKSLKDHKALKEKIQKLQKKVHNN